MGEFFAHSENDAGRWHRLDDHLNSVASLAEQYAQRAPWKTEAALAAKLHDLGKYADRFQKRLRGKDSGLDHWSQGAWLALTLYRAVAAALAIQGHHIGLQSAARDSLRKLDVASLLQNHPLGLSLSESDLDLLQKRPEQDGLRFEKPEACAIALQKGMQFAVASMLDVRMLFSCLVDADFLDTESHLGSENANLRRKSSGVELDAVKALSGLHRYMEEQVRSHTQADSKVLNVRNALWQACDRAAGSPTGLFTLTAPTGSGKTLAMLQFALKHAAHHKLKRVVLVVPFLSIIEQTARIYRDVFRDFSEHFVLEHHSLAGLGVEPHEPGERYIHERQRRLLSENWDAPIVLTTNVQLLESLFSNRPSACRKLHNLMESVLLFDEAQSLPQHLAVPTLAALSHLFTAYGATIVFATATQPAFESLHDSVKSHSVSGWLPSEIVSEHASMFEALKRVAVRWPCDGTKRSWNQLADCVRNESQVLVVCNLKRHARALLKLLENEEGVFHLSTNLCADHRRAVLDAVRMRLQTGQTCRLISTQCIEAGVDVDFPKVFRAFAPLEAIAQTAGRCNRAGLLNERGLLGEVVVFDPDEEGDWRRRYPTHAYYQASEVTRTMLIERGDLDINSPSIFQNYYCRLYDLSDPGKQDLDLEESIKGSDFVRLARHYRLINQDTMQVLVPWNAKRHQFDSLREEAEKVGISASWMRRAQGLAVNVYRKKGGQPAWLIPAKLPRGGGDSDEWFILEGDFYHETLGLNPPDGEQVFIA